MNKKLYQELASLITARQNCINSNNQEWLGRHEDRIKALVKQYMPSGSGVDCGTKLDIDASNGDKLVFTFSYHHMNDGGYYDGWTDHKAIVTPSLAFGFSMRITGRDRNQIKDYFHDIFRESLESALPSPALLEKAGVQ